jgi:diguanylate cyclase
MALSYEIDSKLKGLTPVLDEHADWYAQVLRRIYYPEEYAPNDFAESPDSFKTWVSEVQDEDIVEKATLESLEKTYQDMTELATEQIRNATNQDQKISVRAFDSFSTIYENFIMMLRRLEMDLAQSDSGLDVFTGLRSKKALWHDMEREMERLSRRGKPFVLALVQIVDHEQIKKTQDKERYKVIMAEVVKMIKKCIRSFDDAYYLQGGEFVMCLKQSEQAGGSAAIARLLRFLEEAELFYEADGKSTEVDLSCCVAEPMPGDKIEELLDNMRKDLGRYEVDDAPALEYIEKSPLQRIVESLESEDESVGS